jgi:hypothetical protein
MIAIKTPPITFVYNWQSRDKTAKTSIKKRGEVVKPACVYRRVVPYNRMKKLWMVLISSLVLGGCTPKDLFVKSPAGLEINTVPTSTVFLNGENKGETPYSDKNVKPGTYTLKLVPSTGGNFPPYETKLNLTSKASTVISRSFAQSDLDASGYTLQLQEESSGETYLSVISEPDTVNVTLDDKPSGFTPLSKMIIAPGAHSLLVTSPGYLEQTLSVNAVKGYNLIVNFKLASQTITLSPSPSSSPTASPLALASTTPSSLPSSSPKSSASPTPKASPVLTATMEKPYVVVSDTADTQASGGLNVRKDASSSSDVLGKAKINEQLKYLGETTEAGWFKVEFESSVGWVSGKYVTLVK